MTTRPHVRNHLLLSPQLRSWETLTRLTHRLFERGVIRASITRLSTRLKDLEAKVDQPTTLDLTQRMTQKLDTLDSEFKVHHFALVDVIDGDEFLLKEQETLNEHDDEIA